MENNLPKNFTNLLLALQYKKTYQKTLQIGQAKYNFQNANIEDLTPYKILQLYRTVIKKFYMSRTKITQGSWFQNELRIYIWLLIGYLFIHKKNIKQMEGQDWQYFIPIFHQRPSISFQFQALSLLPNSKSLKWQNQQMDLLQCIIKQTKFKNKWNPIARQLFIRSQKKYYRSPKQCRERWLNYLDPTKKKTGWDDHEDLLLLKTVLQTGKKWSNVVRILKGTRTQHMVKNRYKSLVTNQIKKSHKTSQNETVQKLITILEKKFTINIQPSSNQNINKTMYQQNSTQNPSHTSIKQQNLPKTNVQYNDQIPNYINFLRGNPQPFYIPNNIYTGMRILPFNSPSLDVFSINKPCFENEMNLGDENEFLMSHQQLQNYLIFEQKQKESLIKDQDLESKQMQMNQGQQFVEKQQKINYFSEEFHDCFRN